MASRPLLSLKCSLRAVALGWLAVSLLIPQVQQLTYALHTQPNFIAGERAQLPITPMSPVPATPVRIPDSPYEVRNTWLPIYNRRTLYNENEIVGLVTEIVRTFIKLSYVEGEIVIWPPAGGHAINETLCDELGVSEAARSLIRRLPLVTSDDINLFESSRLLDFLSDFALRRSRMPYAVEPLVPNTVPGQGLIIPQEVQLSCGDRESSAVFLDIQENTIRVAPISSAPEWENPPGTPPERPDEPGHYRNYWPMHAPSWLRVQLNRIKTLEAIPPGIWALSERNIDCEYEWLRRKIKLILEGTYGWPDDFQQEAYDRDRESVWQAAVDEYDSLGNPLVLEFP